MEFLKAFLCGGLLCVIGQLLIDKTSLTPARILVTYVVSGVVLGGLGLYKYVVEFGGAGATVPLTGFGCWPRAYGQRWRSEVFWVPSPEGSPQPPAASQRPFSSAIWWPWCASLKANPETAGWGTWSSMFPSLFYLQYNFQNYIYCFS